MNKKYDVEIENRGEIKLHPPFTAQAMFAMDGKYVKEHAIKE